LREYLAAVEVSEYELAKRCGVSRSNLTRFRLGETDLSLASLDKIGQALGLALCRTGRRPRASGA
jgi:transcriptional regulator with XRE-family HTH domain